MGETSNGGGIPFRFAGMWLDGESMLYYDHARYYSPVQGRFISPDPIGIKGGVNIYAYAENDSVNSVDLNGNWYVPGRLASSSAGAGSTDITEVSSSDGGEFVFGSLNFGSPRSLGMTASFPNAGIGDLIGVVLNLPNDAIGLLAAGAEAVNRKNKEASKFIPYLGQPQK